VKANLLGVLDVYATVLNAAVWAWIASATILLAALGAAAFLAGRQAGAAVARRIHTRRALRHIEQYANARIPAQTRKEKP
jgi:hypothetical protein